MNKQIEKITVEELALAEIHLTIFDLLLIDKINELIDAFNDGETICQMRRKDGQTVEMHLLEIIKSKNEKIEDLKQKLKEIQMNEGE